MRKTAQKSNITLPESAGFEKGGFLQIKAGSATIFVFPEEREYARAMNPENWGPQIQLGGRASAVESRHNGKPLPLVVRRERSKDDEVAASFSESFRISSAKESVVKAKLIYEKLRYEDDSIVIKAERPLGYVKVEEDTFVEVYLEEQGQSHRRDLKGGDRKDFDKALKKYHEVKSDVNGFMFSDIDLHETDDNLLFSRDSRGRVVITKIDSEYTKVTDLGELHRKVNAVEEMLESSGFDPKHYDGSEIYDSVTGHLVSERLLGACTLMDGRQTREFLSRGVAGEFAKAVQDYSRKGGRKGVDEKEEFMSVLTNILSIASEIVPKQRSIYMKETTRALITVEGDEHKWLMVSSRIEDKYKKIKPMMGEKEGLLW